MPWSRSVQRVGRPPASRSSEKRAIACVFAGKRHRQAGEGDREADRDAAGRAAGARPASRDDAGRDLQADRLASAPRRTRARLHAGGSAGLDRQLHPPDRRAPLARHEAARRTSPSPFVPKGPPRAPAPLARPSTHLRGGGGRNHRLRIMFATAEVVQQHGVEAATGAADHGSWRKSTAGLLTGCSPTSRAAFSAIHELGLQQLIARAAARRTSQEQAGPSGSGR